MFRKKVKENKKPGLPSQEKMQALCLRPGHTVDLLLAADVEKGAIDVRPSILHDVDPKGRLIIAQTFPPISAAMTGKPIEVTFLFRDDEIPGGKWYRVGYQTPLLGIVPNFPLGGGKTEPVLVVAGPAELKQFTVRLHYRLEPDFRSDLSLFLRPSRVRLPIMDISLGGVKVRHPDKLDFAVGSLVDFDLVCRELIIPMEGMILRSSPYRERPDAQLSVTVIRYPKLSPGNMQTLSDLLNELLREKLARRSQSN